MSALSARSVVLRILHSARDHDAYWSRPEAGWRDISGIARAADAMGRIAKATITRHDVEWALDLLVSQGVVQATHSSSYRHREPVTPVGGDERMRQP